MTDREAARRLAAQRQRQADQFKAGLIDALTEHRRRPLIGSMRELGKRPHERNRNDRIVRFARELHREDLQRAIVNSHLADYVVHLQSSRRSEKHIWEIVRVIRRVCIACKFQSIDDLQASVLDSYLAKLIEEGKSYRTRNGALKSLRAFVTWLVNNERIARSPFRRLATIGEQADPNRRRRRSLTAEEFTRLLAATEKGPIIESIPGSERATLYLLASWTGLRRKELSYLTMAHLSLESDPPYVHVPAAMTKAKRDDQPIPLHPFVAERLRKWLEQRGGIGDRPIFHLRTRSGALRKASKMMQLDCEAAGLPYIGDLGVADFHSHRVAFITNLCRTADFSTVVDLARHSDPKLTANIYDRVRLENRTAAINGLPTPLITSERDKA